MRKPAILVLAAAIGSGPALTAPAAFAKYARKTAMQCSAEYELNKQDSLLKGETRKEYIDRCKSGGDPSQPAPEGGSN